MKNVILFCSISIVMFISGCGDVLTTDSASGKIVLTPKIEAMLVKVDELAESMPVIAENTQAILDTPVAKLIPETPKNILGLGIMGLQGLSIWWLRMRKNMFQTGFDELAMANELYYTNGGDKGDNKIMQVAESSALNPPTLKLMAKEGFRRRIINE